MDWIGGPGLRFPERVWRFPPMRGVSFEAVEASISFAIRALAFGLGFRWRTLVVLAFQAVPIARRFRMTRAFFSRALVFVGALVVERIAGMGGHA